MRRRLFALVLLALAGAGSLPAAAQDIAERLMLCRTCHGESGLPQEPDTPIIAGQSFYFLYVQLKDYKSGLRANEIMNAIAADLSKQEMQALAKHFSEQPWPDITFRADDAEIARAQRAAVAGACTTCHLGNYHGNKSDVPRVAGQQPAYLERTMLEMKTKARANNPFMTSLLRTYESDDLAALARWLAGL